jgi:hypothetical protein
LGVWWVLRTLPYRSPTPVPIHRNSGSLSGAPHPRSRHVRGIPNPISPDPSTIPLVTSMIPSIVREKTSPPSDATTAWQCFVYGSGSGWSVPCRPLCVDSTDPFASPMHCRYAPFTVTHITSDSDIRILIRITAYKVSIRLRHQPDAYRCIDKRSAIHRPRLQKREVLSLPPNGWLRWGTGGITTRWPSSMAQHLYPWRQRRRSTRERVECGLDSDR